jgi:hypothetical protein
MLNSAGRGGFFSPLSEHDAVPPHVAEERDRKTECREYEPVSRTELLLIYV